MIEVGLAKSFKNVNISSDSPTTHVNQHASNSSAAHVPLENPQCNMSLNYFSNQAHSARTTFLNKEKSKTAIVLSQPMVKPITSISSSATTNELANFVSAHQPINDGSKLTTLMLT
jgi:hypothetical protein